MAAVSLLALASPMLALGVLGPFLGGLAIVTLVI
jgi:hypothetical protein